MSFGGRTAFRALFALSALVLTGPVLQAQVLVTDWGGRLTDYHPSPNTSNVIAFPQSNPGGMVIGSDGVLYMAQLGNDIFTTNMEGHIDKYNPVTGAPLGTAVSAATLGANFQPTGLAFYNNELYIARQTAYPGAPGGSGGVYKYNFGSSLLTPIVTGLTQAEGLAVVGNNLFIGELNNYTNGGRILKRDLVTNMTTTFVDQVGTAHAPAGITLGPDGMLYVCDITGMEIHKYDPNNAAINATVVLGGPGLNSPTGVAFFGGSMYVSNVGSGSAPDGFLSRYDDAGGGNYVFAGKVVDNLFFGSAVVAVPEPTSLVLLLMPAGGWLIRRRLAK